jgi:formylglycine-generating enzyme required for sulfatase activity
LEIKLTPEEEAEAIPNADHVADFDFTNSLGMRMVFVRPGRFRIPGDSAPSEITHAFWIAQYEVTVAQYLYYCEKIEKKTEYPEWLRPGIASIESEKSKYAPLRDEIKQNAAPVVGLTSAQMGRFCSWLSQQTGEPLDYSLPTPNQWICAYRSGTNTTFYWGDEFDDTNANLKISGDRYERIALVGQFPANRWGLRDMAGNVWEMTNSTKVFGGGWDSDKADDALPVGISPKAAPPSPSIGFRVVGLAKSKATKTPQ